MILEFDENLSEVWCMAISSIGDFFVSAGNDLSIRLYD